MPIPSDIPLTTIDGKAETLGAFDGKALLIVNVASKCGFTPQYEGLEALHQRFRDRGFAVLGFPCDQFGHQEPGDERDRQFLHADLRRELPDVRQGRGQRRRRASVVPALKSQRRACSGPKRSSGTSPSSCSTETTTSCAATPRPTSRKKWGSTSRRRCNGLCAAAANRGLNFGAGRPDGWLRSGAKVDGLALRDQRGGPEGGSPWVASNPPVSRSEMSRRDFGISSDHIAAEGGQSLASYGNRPGR